MDYLQLSDEQLMSHIAEGQEAALALLYERYAAAVMGLAFKVVGDRSVAEEIVQETFYRVWDKSRSFHEQKGSVTSWLFRIARNLAIDSLRRQQVRPQAVESEPEAEHIERTRSSSANVVEAAWLAIKREQVQTALRQLPEEQRQVMELAYFGGLTRREIAAETGVALGTIHTRARLALQKLQQTLQGFDE
jgi:RNA polymerase sigma-70 factor (ECF subfamily)